MDCLILTHWIRDVWSQLKKIFELVGVWRVSFILIVICSWLIKSNSHFNSLDSDDYEDLLYPFSFQSIQHSILEFIIQVLIPIWYTLQTSVTTTLFRHKTSFCPNLENDYHCSNCANTIKRLLDAKNNMVTKDELNKITSQLDCIQNMREEVKLYSNELNNLKNEIKTHSSLALKVNKINNVLDIQGRKIENIKNHYPLMDENKKRQLVDMFKSAEVSVDFLKRRDDQLKELFKTTTDLTLKHDKVYEDIKSMKKSFNELLKHIKLNNEDFAKFVEYSGSIVEESIFKKVKSDLLNLTNEFEQLRTESFSKLTVISKIEDVVNNLLLNFQNVFESVNQCDERVSKYCKELNGFKDEIERLSVLLHNDIEGKINGILKFMGKSSNHLVA